MSCWRVDVELGLASRSDLLQILKGTDHGGRSVQGVSDGQGGTEKNKRLNKSMIPSGSFRNVTEAGVSASASSASEYSIDSPGHLFQRDLPAAPGLSSCSTGELLPSDRTHSCESMGFALASEPSVTEPSVKGGDVFDTAQDIDQRPLRLAAAEQQPPDLQGPARQGPAHWRTLYAYGIADPGYMSLPCKMSMKHARVLVNHETNSRLYGKKLPGQVRPKPRHCPPSSAYPQLQANFPLVCLHCWPLHQFYWSRRIWAYHSASNTS